MKENKGNEILLALLAGAAVGVAIGYFLNSEKKEEIIGDIKSGASKIKDELTEELEKGKIILDELIKKASA